MTENELKTAGKKIRLAVCDMDGTLLDSRKNLSERTVKAVLSLRRAGVGVTVCSGRVYTMLEFYVRRLELDIPFISSNGAVIFDPRREKILHQKILPAEDAERLFAFCARQGFDYCALGPEGNFFSPGGKCIDRFVNYNRIAAEGGLREMPLCFFDENHRNALRTPIHKVLIYRLDTVGRSVATAFLKECGGIDHTFSEPELVDVVAKGVDKGYGVRQLAGILGYKKEEICVFGDYLNDLPMFGEAGIAVAMGNAPAHVRDRADFVTAANDEDGVARVLDRLAGFERSENS